MSEISSVTFGITCFERPKELHRLLKSIYLYFQKPDVIVVCDSKNKSKEKKLAKEFDEVNFIFTDYDIGLSAKRNIMFRNSKKDFILILEEDFEFRNNNLIQAIQTLKRGKLDLCAGRVVNIYQLDLVNLVVALKKILIRFDFSRLIHIFKGSHVDINHYGWFRVNENKLLTNWNDNPLNLMNHSSFDMYPNFFIIRKTKLIELNGWQPEQLKNGEHGLFFIRLFESEIKSVFLYDFDILHKPKKRLNYLFKRMRRFDVDVSNYYSYKEIKF